MNFDLAFTWILHIEGGYVNDPKDPGGETKFGISKRSYPQEDIQNLTTEQAKTIYRRDYWDKCCCDDLPSPLNLVVFDMAVNHGPRAAAELLNTLLESPSQSTITPETILKAQQKSQKIIPRFLVERALQYISKKNFCFYGKGWMRRLFELSDYAAKS